ncbi:cell fate regulator YaaT (PSP1 superfamily) [Desulfobaculum xiamenense]|uniref:Cell fate regulator YaaT (PSP1 superfamily) n=1 Tax=Desulfobaculum xiamenense TaxID=995050 RepID=A0A846QL85_9BACT|nr:regulatory iron-sulfur-containing complex subunit RicT [Desulfobaculum xiamenense]NJB68881.1 cell fate regulator YaaT (PSP1 superfamily) [Desulfobaculum xiamenense]
MGHALGLKFSDYGQIYYFDSGAFVVNTHDSVIVKTDQGMGLGAVITVTPEPPEGISPEELKPIFRLATEEDLVTAEENRTLAREAFRFCRRCISERELEMKLVDVEVFFDRGKIIFYFTAPGRIDFRELVKDLVKNYRTRIELRQIGVRHETQMIGAVGNCGQVACCRRFMRKFAPVTIKMAKEQNLFLNPTKISGICGRLLCCLSFEEKNYEEFYRQCPKIGKRMDTDDGILKVLRANFFRGSISVLSEFGEERELTLEEWQALNPRRIDPQQLQKRLQEAQATMRTAKARPQRGKPRPGARAAQSEDAAAPSDAAPAPAQAGGEAEGDDSADSGPLLADVDMADETPGFDESEDRGDDTAEGAPESARGHGRAPQPKGRPSGAEPGDRQKNKPRRKTRRKPRSRGPKGE